MRNCSQYSHEVPIHVSIFLHAAFYLNITMNPFLIYCIIFRSTVHMKRYRWYLLWHQVASMCSDLLLNWVATPLIFLPFAMGYPIGVGRGIIPTHTLTELGIFIISVSLSSVSHLFTFRFLVSKGLSNFPTKYVVKMVLRYSVDVALFFNTLSAFEDQEEVFQEMKREFSCITDEMHSNPDFIFYRSKTFFQRAMIPGMIGLTWLFIDIPLTVRFTMKNLHQGPMSERTIRMHKMFLRQLILQIAIPMGVLIIPVSVVIVFVTAEIQASISVGLYFTCSVSLFSILGGTVLIVMNKTYRPSFLVPKTLPWNTSQISHVPVVVVSRHS